MKSRELCYTKLGEDMTENLINLTEETIESFKKSSLFKNVKMAEEALKDEQVKLLLETYKEWQDTYLEAKKYGSYHPDLKAIQVSYQTAKIQLYSHPLIVEYFEHYHAFQALIDTFTQDLAKTISAQVKIGHIPH